jgi:hypothetical protein
MFSSGFTKNLSNKCSRIYARLLLGGFNVFQVDTTTSELTGKATSPVSFSELLDKVRANVPKDYHDYADIFNKAQVDTLAQH